ncbi:hypothetical protein PHMEG_00014451 [Phytophthora megakarya]|uniref:Uncharacterized protein n=1 Tax=Phytophthora megakarya TaxID=4795 RepID=A0A225W3R6_9STRA|nr:hypothetical protein PHMEG_00014451 [Phytophthora megakarya]
MIDKSTYKSIPQDEDGGREVFDGPLQRKPDADSLSASPKKIYPVETKNLKNTEKGSSKSAPSSPQTMKFIVIQVTIGLAVCICLSWTLWLILLNIAPNDTVNRVMNTKSFDYGSFWLMVDPSKTMMGFATFGLSVVAIGYLGVLVKMLLCLRNSKQAYMIHQMSTKKKTEKSQNEVEKRGSRVASATLKLAATLIDEGNPTRKRIKLLLKVVDLALETLLLYQMLETGSPAPLIVIFTLIVASNAVACATMMFVPHERAPLAETLIDIL